MPAIQLGRLAKQIEPITSSVDNPAQFKIYLHEILHYYGDRTYRPGDGGQLRPILATYQIKSTVLRQIFIAILRYYRASPYQTLALCESLWSEEFYELKLFAIELMSIVPIQFSENMYLLAKEWGLGTRDETILEELFTRGLEKIREDHPDRYAEFSLDLLSSTEIKTQAAGLQALLPLLKLHSFDNFPAVFHRLGNLLKVASPELTSLIFEVTHELYERTPAETRFFIKQTYLTGINPRTSIIIRRIIANLPENDQKILKAELF